MPDVEIYNTTPVMQNKQVGTEIAISRQAQEVQAAMVVAKRFPRDEFEAQTRIMQACERFSLADKAEYSYPRGGERVTGPSIRLAEVLAREWGNIDFGIVELEQRSGESTMMAYAWDLETNVRQTRIFTQKHERKTKARGLVKLDDPRDIYEITANNGARRLRACILGTIPGDVVEMAQAKCRETVAKGDGRPLIDRIRDMVLAFDKLGVTKDMIEKYIGHPTENFTIDDIKILGPIFNSLRDGVAKREEYFEIPRPKSATEEDFHASQQTESESNKHGKKKQNEPAQTGGDVTGDTTINEGQLL